MNPVQFKVSSIDDAKTELKGMTVFNTEQVTTKKQPMFFANLKSEIRLLKYNFR